MNGMQRFLALAAIMLLAGLAGYFGYRATGDSAAPVTGVAQPATTSPAAGEDAALPTRPAREIPERLPEFTLKDRDGVPRTLAHWAGRPLLVNFWATWCAPCRREIPLLTSLRAEHADEGLEVIGIAVDFREDVLKYAEEIGLEYPLLIGEQDGLEAAAAFGVEPLFPFSVFSDRQGRIVAVRIGELHADEAAFILDRVREVGANRLELPVAQQQIADKLRELAVLRAQSPS
ncbi:MAG TPA: TlpA disulfide reductase family protein [Steroidobacteraceae bacterium]|jgi:thiol-disulfide isomerase/thioredoxin|nr:TlpA disulfide reductase family protein [Steroidobacteraceae bacterium]HNS28543.1 TlpA disulfide reductase family protein [Steroidobacteraceae bacterium]